MNLTEVTYRSPLPVPAADVQAWHDRPGAFERLTPPWMDVHIAASQGTTAPGDWKRLRVGIGPFSSSWTLVHHSLPETGGALGFLDEQCDGPFRAWRHEHRFVEVDHETSLLEDRLMYQLPLGKFGDAIAGRRMTTHLDDVFGFRHRRTQLDLSRHGAYRGDPLSIVVSGASGLVGSQLVAFLRSGGHVVHRLVRRTAVAPDEISWNPQTGEIDAAALEGMDAVVHLAGESIAAGRWTKKRMRHILASRVEGTRLLADTIAQLKAPPRVLVSASAVGYYGSRGEELLTEESNQGEGFLTDVVREWEEAAAPVRSAGIRVVSPRFGVILAGNGGMLARVTPLFRLGLGGRLGDGAQYLSWVALDDVIYALHRIIVDASLHGPLNVVAPHSVTNREFTATLGTVLGRPAVLPAPAPVLRLAFGEMADEVLLTSQRALPARLTEHGYHFAFRTLEDALRHELDRVRAGYPSLTIPTMAPSTSPLPDSARLESREAA